MAKRRLPKIETCPFCGSKMELAAGMVEWHFWCKNEKCAAHICFPITNDLNVFPEDVIKKFNTRKETKK